MKKLFFLAGVVCLMAVLVSACAPPPEPEPEVAPEPVFDQVAEEAAVRKMMEDVFAAFNRHDATAETEYYAASYLDFDSCIYNCI